MDVKCTFVLLFLPSIVGVVNSIGAVMPCDSGPCLNGGTCNNGDGSTYTCDCPAGFTGDQCEHAQSPMLLIASLPCDSEPCLNGGTCNDGDGSTYTCDCPAGNTGAQCGQAVLPCDSGPCQNGGTCNNGDGSTYTCDCPAGFTGDHCQQEVMPCDSGPCLNGGTCNNVDGSTYTCDCPAGFTGTQCEQVLTGGSDACNSRPLVTMTTTTIVHVNQAAQSSGVTGNMEIADPCVPNPCQNEGTCTSTEFGGYSCMCSVGYTGLHCENGAL